MLALRNGRIADSLRFKIVLLVAGRPPQTDGRMVNRDVSLPCWKAMRKPARPLSAHKVHLSSFRRNPPFPQFSRTNNVFFRI